MSRLLPTTSTLLSSDELCACAEAVFNALPVSAADGTVADIEQTLAVLAHVYRAGDRAAVTPSMAALQHRLMPHVCSRAAATLRQVASSKRHAAGPAAALLPGLLGLLGAVVERYVPSTLDASAPSVATFQCLPLLTPLLVCTEALWGPTGTPVPPLARALWHVSVRIMQLLTTPQVLSSPTADISAAFAPLLTNVLSVVKPLDLVNLVAALVRSFKVLFAWIADPPHAANDDRQWLGTALLRTSFKLPPLSDTASTSSLMLGFTGALISLCADTPWDSSHASPRASPAAPPPCLLMARPSVRPRQPAGAGAGVGAGAGSSADGGTDSLFHLAFEFVTGAVQGTLPYPVPRPFPVALLWHVFDVLAASHALNPSASPANTADMLHRLLQLFPTLVTAASAGSHPLAPSQPPWCSHVASAVVHHLFRLHQLCVLRPPPPPLPQRSSATPGSGAGGGRPPMSAHRRTPSRGGAGAASSQVSPSLLSAGATHGARARAALASSPVRVDKLLPRGQELFRRAGLSPAAPAAATAAGAPSPLPSPAHPPKPAFTPEAAPVAGVPDHDGGGDFTSRSTPFHRHLHSVMRTFVAWLVKDIQPPASGAPASLPSVATKPALVALLFLGPSLDAALADMIDGIQRDADRPPSAGVGDAGVPATAAAAAAAAAVLEASLAHRAPAPAAVKAFGAAVSNFRAHMLGIHGATRNLWQALASPTAESQDPVQSGSGSSRRLMATASIDPASSTHALRRLLVLVAPVEAQATFALVEALVHAHGGSALVLPDSADQTTDNLGSDDPVGAAHSLAARAAVCEALWRTQGARWYHALPSLRAAAERASAPSSSGGPAWLTPVSVVESAFVEAIHAADMAQELELAQTLGARLDRIYEAAAATHRPPGDTAARALLSDKRKALQRVLDDVLARTRKRARVSPLHAAVYFVGPRFSDAERDRWFVYRQFETDDTLALINSLREAYPFATVVGPTEPVTIGALDDPTTPHPPPASEKPPPPPMPPSLPANSSTPGADARGADPVRRTRRRSSGGSTSGGAPATGAPPTHSATAATAATAATFHVERRTAYRGNMVFLGTGAHGSSRRSCVVPAPGDASGAAGGPPAGAAARHLLQRWPMAFPTVPGSYSANHIYVYPAAQLAPQSLSLDESERSPGAAFRVWVPRAATQLVHRLPPGVDPAQASDPMSAVAATTMYQLTRPVRHPISSLGPCITRKFNVEDPVDDQLVNEQLSAVVAIDLELEDDVDIDAAATLWASVAGRHGARAPAPPGVPAPPPELSSRASTWDGSTDPGSDAGDDAGLAAPLRLRHPWLSRRCPVSTVHVRSLSLATACLQSVEWARNTLANRLQWVYSITVRSDNPNDAAALWPTRRRARSSFTAMDSPVNLGVFGVGQGGSAPGTKKVNIYGSSTTEHIIARAASYRRLVRSERFTNSHFRNPTPSGNGRTSRAGSFDGAVEDAPHTLKRSDSLESIDVGAKSVPLPKVLLGPALGAPGSGAAAGVGMADILSATPAVEADHNDVAAGVVVVDDSHVDLDAVVSASGAAQVVYAAVIETTHPVLAFATGPRVCEQLVDDYKELKVAYMTKKRTLMKRAYLR